MSILKEDIMSNHFKITDLKDIISENKKTKISLDKKIDYNHKMIKLNNYYCKINNV